MDAKSISRAIFRHLNRFIIVPAFKMGLGRVLSNPLTGQVMVLKFKGRKTGKTYYTPVSYAAIDGKIYCYQGKRLKGQWYLNLLADPRVEVLLPDGHLLGFAEDVTDCKERADAVRQILKSSGLGGFVYGFNPGTASDKVILEKTRDIPVVRINPQIS
jgi:hypothetical protein